jgi:DNA (cytosine-5)-methyltransferase 1
VTFGSLFAGCGGMDRGLENAGWECRWQVEINPFANSLLERHWPYVPRYGDVTAVSGDRLERVNLIAGGFPCQDLSCAGKQAGIDGERSGLWSHYARIIREVRPRYVLIENVPGLLANEPMRRVLGDLSALGFDAEWRVLPLAEFGSPCERERVFVVAYAHEVYGAAGMGSLKNGARPIFAGSNPERSRFWVQASNLVARMGDGVPKELYRPRGEAIGNAVSPVVAEWIGRRIMSTARTAKTEAA